jgi:hypothetical protein
MKPVSLMQIDTFTQSESIKKTEGKSKSTKNSEGITPSNALSIILHLKLFKKRNFIKSGF